MAMTDIEIKSFDNEDKPKRGRAKCCGITVRDLEGLISKYEDKSHSHRLPNFQDITMDEKDEKQRLRQIWDGRKLKPSDVALHNTRNDCWLSWNGVVRDLTPVVKKWSQSPAVDRILEEAGKDVSHWFDKEGNLRTYISKLTGTRRPYLPRGELPETYLETYPSGLNPDFPPIPWWKNKRYIVGYLTAKTRQIAITNTHSVRTAYVTVCEEDSIEVIQMRYNKFNSNSTNYTWKYDERKLDMKKTLDQNNIPDYAEKFRNIGLPEDTYIPNLFLYFNDNI